MLHKYQYFSFTFSVDEKRVLINITIFCFYVTFYMRKNYDLQKDIFSKKLNKQTNKKFQRTFSILYCNFNF